ncbi:LGFP repeat-containing protein [Tsukamurella pulmonis]|uniref:LGFP repeat-containing protein n=1 Tax=Tsukamurella pulmonis TaxID=47312 RepID=UPI0008399D82|nr:hypothetical protein [Tsukamurella pulmonis]
MSGRLGQRGAAAAVMALSLAAAAIVAPAAHADQLQGGRWVKGQIEVTYNALGGPDPYRTWGATLTDESNDRRGGKFQVFQNDASIYWHPAVDGGNAHQIGGAIRAKWGEKDWEAGPLGYPTSDERRLTKAQVPVLNWGQSTVGAWNDFQGGSVMWTSSTGARIVWGEIKRQYDLAGGVSKLGWPTTDETRDAGGRFVQKFQNGVLTWPATAS